MYSRVKCLHLAIYYYGAFGSKAPATLILGSYDYNSLDDELKAEFENLVNYFVSEGIEVIFYLPPYHPIVYDYINKHEKYREVLLAEKYFKDFAIDNSIELYGSYDPACCDCNE
ncbi:hypothetical protein [Enterocloster bolteae]|uniref:hypothetical protein n=1 Tax=Enterocloster bolteae TaxID=208479 RepID=UPI002A80EFAA|nr:hypothetical protein [Enterocloster bolteae]